MRSFLTLADLGEDEILSLVVSAAKIKAKPGPFSKALSGKILLMIFEKPSLRTRVSFEAAMKSMGGSAIVVDTQHLPIGKKESVEDTAKVSSRYVHAIMARLYSHAELETMAECATIPVINGLTDDHHPVQILCDLLTIKEKKGRLAGLKLCFLGDGNNNVTHSLIEGCSRVGINIAVGCPKGMKPNPVIVANALKIARSEVLVIDDPKKAIRDADIVYTDTWMSYQTPEAYRSERIKQLSPYQVNAGMVKHARKDYIFMNCLPAMRGLEQTADIIDGQNSVVFDQAENRLHMQKALLLWLLGGKE